MTPGRAARVLLALTLGGVLHGCTTDPSPQPDCGPRIEHHGTVYRAVSVVRMPAAGSRLGEVSALDCDGSALEGGPTVVLHAAAGFDPEAVVLVTGTAMASLYVDQDLDVDDWPARLRIAGHYPECSAPAALEGTWQSGPDSSGVAPPDLADTALVQAIRSRGPEVVGWAWVEVLVRIPGHLTHAAEAIEPGAPVRLSTRCEGDGYVAAAAPQAAHRR
ncbi:hypothetical protein [Mumia sp. DW29H23]|uniref:hypothetical protein n=1 Tax=Mumia sp. DW29H23 TaxID=3421241 RepID=UPI003D69C41E